MPPTENSSRHYSNSSMALLVVFGMTLIATNDAILKLSTSELNVGQILCIRGGIATILFLLIIKFRGLPLAPAPALSRWNWLRAGCECLATVCFVTALALLPLAIVAALVWVTPILLTISAALIYKEQVSIGRWLAVLTGFGGVVLVTNPFSAESSPAMLLPLLAAVFVCVRDLITRKIPKVVDSAHIVLATLIVVTIAGLGLALQNWQPVSLTRVGWLSLCAVLLSGGFFCHITAIRNAELSFVAPFSYFAIVMAVIYGYLIWNELPSTTKLIGIVLIIVSGIYILAAAKSQPQ